MTASRYELFFAIRPRLIAHYCGRFLLIVAALNLVSFTAALLYGEARIATAYAAIIGLLFGSGFLLSRIPTQARMQLNEAMVLVALIFLIVPLVAAVPQVVSGIPFLDALFETVSAATTTGLSTLGPIEHRPLTFRFARAWMQWYGGLGIVVFSLALIVRPGMSALRLSKLETPDDLVGGTRAHARNVLLTYTALTLGAILLWIICGGELMQGILFILSAVSTGGFAPSSGSFADLPGNALAWVVTLSTLSGALPLALYQRSWRKNWRQFFQDLEFRALLSVGFLLTFLLGLNLWFHGMPFNGVLTHAPLMALSAQTTSGFSSLSPGTLDSASKAILILAMSTGGGIGSTAGGFKLLRLLLLFGLFYRSLKAMSVPPDAVVDQRLGKRLVDVGEVQDALMIILMFIGVVFCSWMAFLLYGYSPLDSLFEVVSATGTVGLSSGVTDSSLPAVLKLVLCVDMLLGRLEFVAWLVFFYYRTWFGRKREET